MMISRNSMTGIVGGLVFGLLGVCSAIAAAESAPAESEFSDAEVIMWMTDQLKAVTQPSEIHYKFEKTGTLEAGFTDKVVFRVNRINDDGTKAAAVEFFTGERNFPVGAVQNATTNPVLKVYFQGDVYEMNRLTDPDGSAKERWRYFQRRIKFALADGATVSETTFEFEGRSYAGFEVRFQPYANDPRRDLFEKFAEKSYRIVISKELPGYIYEIETRVSDKENPGTDLIREYLRLSSINSLE